MATADYISADLAISPSINSGTSKRTVPHRFKWPAVKKVLKSKHTPSEEQVGINRLELRTPDYHSTLTPFYRCFNDDISIIKLLDDLRDIDSELATYLEKEHLSHNPDPVRQILEEDREISFEATPSSQGPIPVGSYVDFLGAFVGLFLQSRFLADHHEISSEHDPYHVLSSLASTQCPEELHIFRRVFVSPRHVTTKLLEGEVPDTHNEIPVNHLAKLLDIVVVNFLSSVTEHTSPAAVSWSLDYLLRLLRDLHSSMGLLSSPGWYGAPPIRSRKRTIRPSVTHPPILVPPLVIVGSLPLDPETGQSSLQPSSSPHTTSGLSGFRSSSPLSVISSVSPTHGRRGGSSVSPTHGRRGGSSVSPTHGRRGGSSGRSLEQAQSPSFTKSRQPLPTLESYESSPWHQSRVSPPRSGSASRFRDSRLSSNHDDEIQARVEGRYSRSPRSVSPPPLGSIQEDAMQEIFQEHPRAELTSDQRRSSSPAEDVRSKVKSPDIPEVDKENELKTGITAEGRISLIAILTAISKLPQSQNLWSDEVGEKCFSLIQLCLDLGLPPKSQDSAQSTQAQGKRQKFKKSQDNVAFSKHGTERPSVVHTRCVVEASVGALIQCGTCLIVGCVREGSYCSLGHLRYQSKQSQAFQTRLSRSLRRIDDHSPATFRQALANFSQPSNSSARKLFHFLHVVLQYCSDCEVHSTNSLVVDVVVSVLRAAVDRLVELDITEQSIQNSIVKEACAFFQFSHHVLTEHSLSHIRGTAHLEMYLHRIALSVILPPSPQRADETLISPKLKGAASPLIAVRGSNPSLAKHSDVQSSMTKKTLSAKKGVIAQPAVTALQHTHKGLGERTRSGSLSLPAGRDSPKLKGKFKKQRSLHSDIGRQSSVEEARGSLDSRPSGTGESLGGAAGSTEESSEWRGLKLDLLRVRIQRLVVLLNTSIPGTVPDPNMLASLIDLCDGKTVVARAMVLLECAMFVSRLRTQELPTVWVIHNKDHNSHLMRSVSHQLMKWGAAISDKLRVIELREREMKNRHKFAGSSSSEESDVGVASKPSSECPVLDEEPVLPSDKEEESGREYSTVSYAIKMAACQLLLEITRFVRDPPPQFCEWPLSRFSSLRQNSVFGDDSERKHSVSSAQSSDNDSIQGAIGPTSLPSRDFFEHHSTGTVGRFGSNLSAEDAEPPMFLQNTVEDSGGSSSPTKKRVSVYLRVNSTGGTISRSSSLRRSPKVIRVVDSPAQGRANTSSTAHPRREALTHSTLNALHQSLYSSGGRGGRRPSVAGVLGSITVASHHPLPAKYRRQSVAGPLFKHQFESERTTPLELPSSKTSTGGVTLTNLKNKARRAMHTLRRRPTKTTLSSESGPSPNSSPGHRRKLLSTSNKCSRANSFSTHPVPPEDRSLQCSWLGVIEHLIVVEHSSSGEVRLKHTLACRQLLSALGKVYSTKFEEERGNGAKAPTVTRSLSLMFTHRISHQLSGGDEPPSLVGGTPYKRDSSLLSDNLSRRRYNKPSSVKRVSSVPAALSKRKSYDALSEVSFSRLSSLKLPSTSMRATESDESIELFLESESTYPQAYLTAELDKLRRDYLSSELLGMIHVPFSILVHAAPALHSSTLSRLKFVAWEALLSVDAEHSRAAGAFFLLACLKESSSGIKGFMKEHVIKGGPSEQHGALRRFKVLWESRYHVWPRMEERAQKKLCVNDSKKSDDEHKTIGYSLPANLLGQVSDTLPIAPWDFSAVCTNKTCADNPNLCYHSTQHVPVVHGNEIAENVKEYHVSGVSLLQEASSKPANVFLGIGADDDIGNIEKWEAVKTTLFPHSLLPLIRFIIMALSTPPASHPHTSTSSQDACAGLDTCELARQVVWQCMLEDEYLFFQPLLDQFNKLYSFIKENTHKKHRQVNVDKLMVEILEPFHVILQSFHSLPSRAAHFLFNNFVGVVMKHTDQPVVHSPRIIQSVLTLVSMVAPNVQGLNSKVLKNSLKKENCYTTVMTTARIRGTEKVYVSDLSGQKVYPVTDGMTFARLISQVCGDRLSLDLLNTWYLFDTGKDVPVLSSLYIQDHYSAPLDRQYPVFCLKGAGPSERLWTQQLDQLFVHKMSELMRVQFAIRLLRTGPEVEKGVAYSEYAQPNYQFIYKELVELNSFPRKALTSVVQEAGQGALHHSPLHTSDIMLKGTWVMFILELFKSVKPEFNWANNMVLFLNVISGALLLHGENHTILRTCLVTLLTAAAKFNSVFKREGYQIVVPTLIQVYALHMQNQLIIDTIELAWFHFYLLDGNTFISQMAASGSTLFSETIASLSSKVSSSHTPLPPAPPHMEGEVLRKYQERAAFELSQSLYTTEPPDHLDLMLSCQQTLDESSFSRLNSESRQRLSLENAAALLITLSTWNPEALRGAQVLVYIDHTLQYLLKNTSSSHPSSLVKSLEYLIKGCESIARYHQFRKDNASSTRRRLGRGAPADPQTPGYPADKTFNLDLAEPDKPKSGVRKVSVVIQKKFRRLVNPNQKGLQGNLSDASLVERSIREKEELPGAGRLGAQGLDHKYISSQFKLRRLQHETQQILQVSRDALLSIATQFVAHFVKVQINEAVPHHRTSSVGISRKISFPSTSGGTVRPEKITLHSSTVSVLTFTAIQLIKQSYSNEHYEGVLQGRGLTGFMTYVLPNIEWSEPYFASFQSLLNRLLKFFKYLQKESNKAMMVWDSLTGFISGLTLTIHNSPNLVQGQEQNLQKLKLLLETIVTVQHSSGGNPQNQSASALRRYRSIQRIHTHLLQAAPVSFSEAVVGLVTELIVLTHTVPQSKLRYHLSDLLYHKVIKEHEELLMSKMVLPVCIHLGLREDMDRPCLKDAEFVLDYIDKNVDFVIKPTINPIIMNQKLPPDIFFRDLKVVCLTFSETFTLQHWHKISQWVISLTQRKALVLTPLNTSILSPNRSSGMRGSRLSSISMSSQTGTSTDMLESFWKYHDHMLRFFETFLVLHHVPLRPLLFPLLRVQESQLQNMLHEVKSVCPSLIENVNQCIDRCHALLSSNFNSLASVSRHQLLKKANDNLRHLSQPTRVQRSATSVNSIKPPIKKKFKERRSSYAVSSQPPLSKIGEDDQGGNFQLQTTTLPKKMNTLLSPERRPVSLKFKGKSVTKHYVPPSVRHSTGSDQAIGAPSRRPKRQVQRPKVTLSSQSLSQKRAPKLKVLGKLGSSEFHADSEADEYTPSSDKQLSSTNPSFDDEYVIENLASLSPESSPAVRRAENGVHHENLAASGAEAQRVVVSVEVHENHMADTTDEPTPVQLDLNEGTGTESGMTLLSPEDTACNGGPRKEGVSGVNPAYTQSLPSSARQSTKQTGKVRKVSFSNEVKVSSSLDRKAGGMLSSALKESSKYMYQSLEDESND